MNLLHTLNSKTKMNTSELKADIKCLMNAMEVIESLGNMTETEKIESYHCFLKNMEFVIKNQKEKMNEQEYTTRNFNNYILSEFHNACIDSTSSKNGYTVKQRDLLAKFKEWYTKMYVGSQPPSGKEITKYFVDKYGKCPTNGWYKFSYKAEFSDVDGFNPD